jgi:hypothetical protein
MPHTPFAAGQWRRETLPPAYQDSPRHYRKAVSIADGQIQQTLAALRDAGRLRNAVVVLMSDHGEGLNMKKDKWGLVGRSFSAPTDYGHGAAALGDTQTRVLLAIQRFKDGRPVWQPARTRAPASLVDIAPTLLPLAGVPASAPPAMDGVRLVDQEGRPAAPASRPIFIESGLFGRSLDTLDIDPQAVANEFNHLYEVTDDLRVQLRDDKIPQLMGDKQRAVILGNYGVASLPEGRPHGCWMMVDYRNRTRLCTDDPTRHPVVDAYSRLLCLQFAGDTAFRERWCRHASGTATIAATKAPAAMRSAN